MDRDSKDNVKIDRFSLDVECEEHPSNYLYWSDKLADAKAETDTKKDALDGIKAEKELDYRLNPRDGQKVTESNIKAMIDTDTDVIRAKQDLVDAKRAQNELQAVVSALEHKKSELDNLRHLWIAGYYSDPGRPRSSTDDKEDAARGALNKNKGE